MSTEVRTSNPVAQVSAPSLDDFQFWVRRATTAEAERDACLRRLEENDGEITELRAAINEAIGYIELDSSETPTEMLVRWRAALKDAPAVETPCEP